MHSSNGDILVLIILVFLIACGALRLNIQIQKRQIRDLLKESGAENILVSWKPFDFHISSNTYSVEYEDQNRVKHITTCKFNVLQSSVHWIDEDIHLQ